MAHKHSIYDTDAHFKIDAKSREIASLATSKIRLMQGDHNSERFTFEIPLSIEGHNMSEVDKIEIHYTNTDSQTKETSKDVYKVEDEQISPSAPDVLIFSWLISRNATKYAGNLSFRITFKCLTGSTLEYSWSTAEIEGASIGRGQDNGESVLTTHSDVLEAWKNENLSDGGTVDLQPINEKLAALETDIDDIREILDDAGSGSIDEVAISAINARIDAVDSRTQELVSLLLTGKENTAGGIDFEPKYAAADEELRAHIDTLYGGLKARVEALENGSGGTSTASYYDGSYEVV